MKHRRRRTHHNRTNLERNLIGEHECIPAGNLDELRISPIPMFADHFSRTTKLFHAANAKLTTPAVRQIVYADAIAACAMFDITADFFDPACDFVPERYRQMVNPGNAGAIMFVGMANPGGRNPNQNVRRTDFRTINLRFLQRFSDLSEAYRPHACNERVRPALPRLARVRGNAFESARGA